MRIRTFAIGLGVASLVVAACGEGASELPPVPTTIVDAAAQSQETTTTTVAPSDEESGTEDSTTTTTVFSRLEPGVAEPPPFETVTIATPDGEELYGEFWAGGDTAVLYTHEYDAAQAGSGGQRPPQSSATVSGNTWMAANAGHTVLAIDFRGHGQSSGDYSVKGSQIDIKAAYDFLIEQGYTTVVSMAVGGSAPVVADLSAADPAVDFAGLGMLFTPLAETGFDAGQALAGVDEPVWLVGIDIGSFGGVTKRLEPKVQNLYDRIVFPAVPSGLQFNDVYGDEWRGRQLAFIETVGG
ncbi:MAG: hypothetical protein ACR2N2_05130 [Acidimicrobiia bacterium]